MPITKVNICGSKKNFIQFTEELEDDFGFIQKKVGFKEVAPDKAAAILTKIESDLSRFSLGARLLTIHKASGDIAGINYEVIMS